jgi:mono/diheme cytochrome c family protein
MSRHGHIVPAAIAVLAVLTTLGCAQAPASVNLSPEAIEGREVFLRRSAPACGTCHALSEAGTRGALGPDLDTLDLDMARVRRAVSEGMPLMPAQEGILTPEQIDLLARYLVEATADGPHDTSR